MQSGGRGLTVGFSYKVHQCICRFTLLGMSVQVGCGSRGTCTARSALHKAEYGIRRILICRIWDFWREADLCILKAGRINIKVTSCVSCAREQTLRYWQGDAKAARQCRPSESRFIEGTRVLSSCLLARARFVWWERAWYLRERQVRRGGGMLVCGGSSEVSR